MRKDCRVLTQCPNPDWPQGSHVSKVDALGIRVDTTSVILDRLWSAYTTAMVIMGVLVCASDILL
jgi:hypothetical protein